MSDDENTQAKPKRRFLRFVIALAFMGALFGFGYYLGVGSLGKDPVGSIKGQVKDMTSTVIEKSSDLKRDLTLRHTLNKAKTSLLGAKEEIQRKNFGKAQDEIDKAIILLTEARALPDTHKQVETQIDDLRTRLLDVQDDVSNLKPVVEYTLDVITKDIELLRETAPSL